MEFHLARIHAQGEVSLPLHPQVYVRKRDYGFTLPASAEKVADSIYKEAQKANKPIMVMKAQLYLLQIHHQLSDNGDSASIIESERYMAAAQFPYKAMWQSITAQLYWTYYQAKSDEIDAEMLRDLEVLNNPNYARDREIAKRLNFFERMRVLDQMTTNRPARDGATTPTEPAKREVR